MTPNSVNNAYGSALRSMSLWLPFIRNKIKEANEEIARLAPPANSAPSTLSIGDDTSDAPTEDDSVAALPASPSTIRDVDTDVDETVDTDDQRKPVEDEWT